MESIKFLWKTCNEQTIKKISWSLPPILESIIWVFPRLEANSKISLLSWCWHIYSHIPPITEPPLSQRHTYAPPITHHQFSFIFYHTNHIYLLPLSVSTYNLIWFALTFHLVIQQILLFLKNIIFIKYILYIILYIKTYLIWKELVEIFRMNFLFQEISFVLYTPARSIPIKF